MDRRYQRNLAIAEIVLALLLLYLLAYGTRLSAIALRAIAPAAFLFTEGNYIAWFAMVDNFVIGLAIAAGALIIRFRRHTQSPLGFLGLTMEVVGYVILSMPFLLTMVYGTNYPLRIARRTASPVITMGAELLLAGVLLARAATYLAERYAQPHDHTV